MLMISHKLFQNPCPEKDASFLSSITFWWFTGYVLYLYKENRQLIAQLLSGILRFIGHLLLKDVIYFRLCVNRNTRQSVCSNPRSYCLCMFYISTQQDSYEYLIYFCSMYLVKYSKIFQAINLLFVFSLFYAFMATQNFIL